jgi:hypothetical protein
VGLSLGIDVAGSSELAWQELVELRRWPHWGPTVRSARLDDGTGRLRAGATGSVQTPLGFWLPFRVDEWCDTEPERVWSWRIAGMPATTHSVITKSPSRCRVEMSVPWWAAVYLTVVAVALTRIRRRVEHGTYGD